MKRTAIQNAEYFAARRRRRTQWRRMLACVATAVALCTVLLLMRPAVTLESPQCGLEEHTHGASCYTQVTQVERRVLICGYDDEAPQAPEITEEITNEPAEEPIEAPEEPIDDAIDDTADEPTAETTEPPAEEAEEPTEQPVAEAEPPVEEPEEEPPVEEPIEEPPVEEPTEEPAAEEPVEEPTEEEPAEAPHVHTDACYATVTEPVDTEALTCPLAEDETHTHSFLCYGTWELACPLAEHVHTDACRTGLSEEEQAQVDALIDMIDALPTDEELDDALDALADDPEALEAWYAALLQQVQEALDAYDALTPTQQVAVTNAERLTELRALCEATVLTESFAFAEPTVVDYASTRDFIELNLYDYNGYINDKYKDDKKYPGFQWNGGAYMYTNTFNRHVVDYIDFGNSNITDIGYGGTDTSSGKENGYSKNRVQVGALYTYSSAANTGAINWLWWNKDTKSDITNRPVGMSTGIEALSRTLGNDGYPALSDNTSLAYLFTDGTETTRKAVTKQNTESIDGLFQKDETTGAYYYNSRRNHAQFDSETDTFTLYDQIITPNFIVYPFGNFLPFNTITDSTKATQVSSITDVNSYVQKIIDDMADSLSDSPTKTQLTAMLKKYKASNTTYGIKESKSAIVDYFTANADGDDNPSNDTGLITDELLGKMYNIDWDEETNFFFGMEMKMNFFQPKDGLTGNDGKQPMEFYFTGDDDVWVYIDGVLFLDLSGIHRHVGGKIDFVNGTVEYYALDTENGGDVSDEAYKTYTFKELLEAAGKSADCLNDKGTFKDYSTHSFNFYYMERGSGSSVCRMNFNFPLLKKNSISVTKEMEADTTLLGDPDFKFQVLKENGSDLFIGAGVEYNIQNAKGNSLGSDKTDANGVFTLKAGQTAVFSDIEESAGSYFVRELLDSSVFGQYGRITVNGDATTTNNNVTVGNESFTGLDSPVQDMSNGSTRFRFENHVDTGKLGKLSLTKKVTGYNGDEAITDETFTFKITLDGQALPAGTTYTVGSETCTVGTEGVIVLTAGETAKIENILAGTAFTVEETDVPAHYNVSYQVGDDTTSAASVGGTVGLNSAVAVTVVNRTSTYELPQTGGTGTLVYTAVGLLLCAAALGLYSGKRRRREAAP